VLVAFVAIVTCLVLRAKQQSCDATGICFCKSHLRFLLLAAHAYSENNGGAFPPNLPMLYPEYLDAENVFYCPADPRYGGVSGFGSSWKSGPAEVTDEASSYVYLPGRSAGMPWYLTIAYDKPGNHRGKGIMLGRIDGCPVWYRPEMESVARRILALEAEAFDKWRASGESPSAIEKFLPPEWHRIHR
jgi:hypothetical protein